MTVSDKAKLSTESRSVQSQISSQLATAGTRATRLRSGSFQIKQVSVRMVTSCRAWLRSEVNVRFHVTFRVRARGTRSENSSLVHTARPRTRPPAGKDSAPLEAEQHTHRAQPRVRGRSRGKPHRPRRHCGCELLTTLL